VPSTEKRPKEQASDALRQKAARLELTYPTPDDVDSSMRKKPSSFFLAGLTNAPPDFREALMRGDAQAISQLTPSQSESAAAKPSVLEAPPAPKMDYATRHRLRGVFNRSLLPATKRSARNEDKAPEHIVAMLKNNPAKKNEHFELWLKSDADGNAAGDWGQVRVWESRKKMHEESSNVVQSWLTIDQVIEL